MIAEAVYQRIKQACITAHADGVQICRGRWGITGDSGVYKPVDGCACAMGCVMLGHQSDGDCAHAAYLTGLLGIQRDDVADFIWGFDSLIRPHITYEAMMQGYVLAKELTDLGILT